MQGYTTLQGGMTCPDKYPSVHVVIDTYQTIVLFAGHLLHDSVHLVHIVLHLKVMNVALLLD